MMEEVRISASSLPLLVHCAHPVSPQGASVLSVDKKGNAARVGDAVHYMAQKMVDGLPTDLGVALEIHQVPEGEWERASMLWDNLRMWLRINADPLEGYRAEAAFAYAPVRRTGRLLGFDIGRDYDAYGREPDELAGTADLLNVVDGIVYVDDYKTGAPKPEDFYQWQLRFLALAAARHYGVTRARARVIHVSEYAVTIPFEEELDGSALEHVADTIEGVWNEAPTAAPKPGPHCEDHYCRAKSKCAGYRQWRKK